MRLGILGPLLVADDAGREIPVAAPRQRTLLVALLVHANRVVPVEELAEIVWDGAPPAGAARTLRSYVMRLRQAVGPAVAARILTQNPGYLCQVADDELDVLRFDALCRRGGAAVRAREWRQALGMLAEALSLWRSAPLADIASQLLRGQCVDRLEQARTQAVDWRIEAELQLGHHDQLIPELQALVSEHPLREHSHAQLMLALYRCARAAEALDAFQNARRVLVDELGIEPGPELQRLHQGILAGDPALAASPSPAAAAAVGEPRATAAHAPTVVPQQLPPTAGSFTGRVDELRSLTSLLARTGRDRGAVVISSIGGTAGVGKTALALHWAHQVADRFADGQLYVNLRGYDAAEPVPALDALAGFLRALGVDGRDIPSDGQERAARYRSLLAGRRVLVVLDNAREPEQVRPLLPGTDGCVALVTSRDALAGLAARDGAEHLDLDVLPAADALALLRAMLGSRVDAEPYSAGALAALCCRLPLALRLAAELATARPAVSLARLVGELTDQQRRLDLLDAGGDARTAVRSVFSWSCRHLDPAAARVFRQLSLHPGADFEAHAAAALTGTSCEQADRFLGELARAHLIHPASPGRYGMHDLLRAYARELADTHDAELQRRAALTGLLDHYLHTAAAAMDTLYPAEASRRPRLPPLAGAVAPVTGSEAARGWLDAERANLIAAAAHAADHGWPAHATRLSATLDRYLNFGHHLPEAIRIHSHALRAARRGGDRSAEAAALSHLGFIEWSSNHLEQAAAYQRQALALVDPAGDWNDRARALHRLALAERLLGQLSQAIGHAEQVLVLSERAEDRLGQARALQSLGITKRMQGRFAPAADHQRQALALFDELGDRPGPSVSLRELGLIELRFGRDEPAAGYFRRAAALCRETSNPIGLAEVTSQLGMVRLHRGNHEQAARHQERALAVYREISDQHGEGEVRARLAQAELAAGHHRQAAEHLTEALRLSRGLGARPLETTVLNGLGEALLAAGQPGHARARHAAALDLAGQTGDEDQQARAHYGLARAHAVLGDQDQAGRHRQEAFDLYARLCTPEAAHIPVE